LGGCGRLVTFTIVRKRGNTRERGLSEATKAYDGNERNEAPPVKPSPRAMHRYWPTVALLVGMTTLQVSVAGFSIYLLSGVRAYVTGESLYSKGQKDAQIYLLDYAEFHREADYQGLQRALSGRLPTEPRARNCKSPTPISPSPPRASSMVATIRMTWPC